jgi:uncharacterized protein DUF4276
MSSITIYAVVEGQTEKTFIDTILAPYLVAKNISIIATIIKKPGQRGGDVKFPRAKNDIRSFLRQRSDTYVTTFVDLYGIKEWPGKDVANHLTPKQKSDYINDKTNIEIIKICDEFNIDPKRFIPYIAIHEFEAMLFSDLQILASNLEVNKSTIDTILAECGTPENINNSPQTAPSKRLSNLIPNRDFLKTTTGITIAQEIGIEKIREQCPIFNDWIERMEKQAK